MKKENIIVVLNYNDADETIRYCKMVENFTTIDRIIVVDNLSTDDSVERLKYIESGKVHLLVAKENKGYAAGNNVGLQYILDNKLEGNIIISNPDIYYSDSDLKLILEPLADSKIGLSTGLITTNHVITSNFAWNLPGYWELLTNQFLILYKLKRIMGYSMYHCYPNNDDNIYCNCVSGCFFCMTTDTLKQIGLFDERTFLYGEENILGFKVKHNGQKVCVVTKARVEHNQHHSIKKSNVVKKTSFFKMSREQQINLASLLVYVRYYLKSTSLACSFFAFMYRISDFSNKIVKMFINV